MNLEALKEIMIDQRRVFFSVHDLIERDVHLDDCIRSEQIVLVSGVRRCGKSSLLRLIARKLDVNEEQILYFNFDDERLGRFTADDFNSLYQLHLEMYGGTESKLVMFIDEPQSVDGWEKFFCRMHEKGVKIYATGSNATLLSSEIASSLTGRNIVTMLFPFSFGEFLRMKGYTGDTERLSTEEKATIRGLFSEYVETGGFPLVVKEKNPQLLVQYYQDMLYRDIIARYSLTQVRELRELATYLASNPGCMMSHRKMQNVCGFRSLSTLNAYLHYLEHAYLFFFIRKYDYSVKKQAANPSKVYIIDTGLHNKIGFSFSTNYGKLLENIVFLHLVRRGKEVYYHRGKYECDFVIRDGTEIVEAIQVCASLDRATTYERELNGMRDALACYKGSRGTILTDSEENQIEVDGERVNVVPVWKWLLRE